MTYPMMHLMLSTPTCGQTNACENITFPKPRLREVTSDGVDMGWYKDVRTIPNYRNGKHSPTNGKTADKGHQMRKPIQKRGCLEKSDTK